MDFDDRTYHIIGAAIEVHKELGRGFLEAVYHEAFEIELSSREVPFESQKPIRIFYKNRPLQKSYQADLICYTNVIVEIKALDKLSGKEESQIINYLKATGLETGLLLNFGSASLEYKRFIFSPQISQICTD